ncbi:hypothetical protein UPYG_G00014490 [Umbra pygmaea]|uniref:Proline-rich transmembrane protein 3/4 domain-containing protein n=1 Tax=Umbra pygmaea TaxID=75934 RepID=A0ABD0XJB8_UMBPY
MAPASIIILSLIFSSIPPSSGQVIVRSSSSVPDPVVTPSLKPNRPSSHASGRGDVSIRVTKGDWPTERGGGEEGVAPLTQNRTQDVGQPFPSSQMVNIGSTQSQPTYVQDKTGPVTVSEPSVVASAKGPTPFSPTKPSGEEPMKSEDRESDRPMATEGVGDWQTIGSDSDRVPTIVAVLKMGSAVSSTISDGRLQSSQQSQTALSRETSKMAEAPMDPMVSLTVQPLLSALTTANTILSKQSTDFKLTVVPVVSQSAGRGVVGSSNTTKATDRPIAGHNTNVTSPSRSATNPGSTNHQPQPVITHEPTATSTSQKPSTTTRAATTTEPGSTSSSTTNKPTKATEPGSTAIIVKQSTKTATSPLYITPTLQIVGGRYIPNNDTGPTQRNHSVPLGRPRFAPSLPSSTTYPSSFLTPNRTSLLWNDLSRTLAFAWELHVYGSAGLFLLLMAGAALGLALSPSMHCPHCGALVLANGLLLLVGTARAALFLVDPYGTKKVIPRPAVTALYNLPLPLLVWAQASLTLVAMKGAGVTLLPSALERPPLAAVLAVLQCTILMAADLLSTALSPVVPVTLQCMSICWGLALCMAYLCCVFPRLRCAPAAQPPTLEEGRSVKARCGGRRSGTMLASLLAVCAFLGALCFGLHIYAILWLYGLLGDWTQFGWGWWLVHFWARLLELAWAFSLLLLGSWVFWRPREARRRSEGVAGESRSGGDLPSPGQSSGSTHKHTCWAKIVQSLTGKPCSKSESNGVGGGGGGGAGEVPNNCAGQERSGADISKSLIRNQNREVTVSQARSVKDSNRGRNQRGRSVERVVADGSTGSLLRMQALGHPAQRSLSGSLEREKESGVSLYEFDLRPPSPIDLSRSIDKALHREHLLHGGSLFQPLCAPSPTPSTGSAGSQLGPWRRRNSDPQISDSSEDQSARTESSVPLGGSVLSSVPSRQVTAPPTPSHQGHRWAGVPSSVSCPASLRPSRTSAGHLGDDRGDDTRPFFTPDSETQRGRAGRNGAGGKSYLEVSRQDDSASVSSDIIDL